MKALLTLAIAMFLATPPSAHEIIAGDLQIIHPYIPRPQASAMAAGGFLAIVNNGTEAERLIGVESDASKKVELHESKVDANGIAMMTHVEVLEIPAGVTVSLEQGSHHIMFMGLTAPIAEGQLVKGAPIFEKAGRIEIEFEVEPGGAMDHSDREHGASTQP
ncbi:MAG: hypothetical protein C0524_02020 [Rhodobacter sp.]|nr:hypothetical protein [Rhodobacter sp.]